MGKGRLEAFSDGVIAIIITIMVLELKVPHETSIEALFKLTPIFLSYVISFLHVGIYWNNHHHLFHSVKKVDGPILWANLLLLFFLSLIPFATGWMGENHFADITVTFYGGILLACAVAYYILTINLLKKHDAESFIQKAVGNKVKERLSLMGYVLGVGISPFFPIAAFSIYALVALVWLYPDKRIEKIMNQ